MCRRIIGALALTCPVLFTTPATAQRTDGYDVRAHYQKHEYMVPMRDGTRLFTIVYTPRDTSRPYPVLLYRTPYSIPPYGPNEYREVLGPSEEFDRDGYIFVFQDVRGKFQSEGEFEVIRPLVIERRDSTDVDESTDNYDTIEWALQNVPNHNGRVGQWGISYSAWQTVMGMVNAHPALVAASPQASPSDMFIGDDWHHNGAFRLMYAFSWLSGNARTRSGRTSERGERFDYGTPWGYEFFLDVGTAGRINDLFFQNRVPAWNDFMEHGTYDEYWTRQVALHHLGDVRPATLNVAGWFDAEDFYGPVSIYYTIEKENPGLENTLSVGPWLHGGWRSMDGDHLGCVDFGSKTSQHFQREVQFPFFQHHLKDAGDWGAPEAVVFETGANQWRTFDAWPPRNATPTKLYLREGGRLSFEPPSGRGSDSYVSDPSKPVPFSQEIRTTQGHLWMIEDQRFASARPDVLVYETEPLEQDITVAGPIVAELFAATTGTDTDWIVKVIDVFPGDAPDTEWCETPMGSFQMLLSGEIFRAKFRNSFVKPEPVVPNDVTAYEIDLHDRFHTFKRGHKIMVQIQSTWFPVYDRNPHNFVDIYHAQSEDFQKATQTIYRSREYPSAVEFGVLRN